MSEEKPVEKSVEQQTAEAQQLLQEQFQKKKDECFAEINAVLEKYDFQLDVTTVIKGSRSIMHQVDLIPK